MPKPNRVDVELPLGALPSGNHMYWSRVVRSRRTGRLISRRVLTNAVKDWRDRAMVVVRNAASGVPLTAPLTVECRWFFKDGRRRDTDNARKVLHDAISMAIGIDDRHFLAHDLGVGIDRGNPRVEIGLVSYGILIDNDASKGAY